MVAKGDTANKAMTLLPDCSGKVVYLRHTQFSEFRGEFQLELMSHFEVETLDEAPERLVRQSMNRVTIAKAIELDDRSKVSFAPCVVSITSKCNVDKNGHSYRSTRIADAGGIVAQVMVWGSLATKNDVWAKDVVVDITAAAVNRNDRRFDLRNFSQVRQSEKGQSMKLPTRLTSARWIDSR